MVLLSKKNDGEAAGNNTKHSPTMQQLDPFEVGANRIYHRKDSYATCGSHAAVVCSTAAPDADRRPCQRIRARSASYSGPSASGSPFFSTSTDAIHNNLRSSSYSGAFVSTCSSLALSSFFHCTTSGPGAVPLTPSKSTMPSSGSISLTTPSDPSRAAYPQSGSETMRHAAAKRRKKQLDDTSLGRRLFEKVPLSHDERMNWSNHAIPASSIHHLTLTDSERSVLGEAIRAELKEDEKRTNKHLRFGHVYIREYQIILGDNPSCLGAPLSIGWEWWVPPVTRGCAVGDGRHNIGVRSSQGTSSTSSPLAESKQQSDRDSKDMENHCVERTVDEYEKRRGLRLRGNQLKLSPLAREALLRRIGVPQSEINDASRANYFAQIERSKTIEAFSREHGKMSMFTTGLQDMFGGFVKMFGRRTNNSKGVDVGRGNGTGHEKGVTDIRRLRRTWSEPILGGGSETR